jgi:phosphoglycerol transferase MdoB-like AlkP superfamily enzyme
MFDRKTWYQRIGFQEQWFEDQLEKIGLPKCAGAFTGTCDAAIADWLTQRLERHQPDPQFLYWMTLNSHLPVPMSSALPAEGSCSISPTLGQYPSLCSWYHLVFNVHDSVARMAMSEVARPTVFVVVGDHAPPFATPALRSQFSDAVVPYILLIPLCCDRARAELPSS